MGATVHTLLKSLLYSSKSRVSVAAPWSGAIEDAPGLSSGAKETPRASADRRGNVLAWDESWIMWLRQSKNVFKLTGGMSSRVDSGKPHVSACMVR